MCRYQVGMKRKPIDQQLESDQRPRKQYLFESSRSIVGSCFSLVKPSPNNSMELQKSSQGIVEEAHKSATEVRKE